MHAALIYLVLSLAAHAHVRTMSEGGRPLYWTSPALHFLVNPTNQSGLSDGAVSTEIAGALQAWSVPGTYASSGYQQSPGYPATAAMDGQNTVTFASVGSRGLDYGVVAVTEVSYWVSSGQIAEADITFNDRQFLFTDQEGDTGRTIGGRTAIYLRDVATHEAGHAFGLDHTNVNLSSLIYTAFSGQFTPSGDDKSAITTIYPSTGGQGSLAGNVNGTRGGVFAAHVQAIDLRTGRPVAGALASPDGSFRLGDLPPGPYAVMMEPMLTSVSTISSYFQNVNHRFCGGTKFRRRFYGPCGSNRPAVVEVQAGGSTALGTLAPSCSAMGNPAGSPTTVATAQELGATGGLAFGSLSPGGTHYYRVRGVSGEVLARAIAYSVYSPLDLTVEILDESEANLGTTVSDVESPMPGGYTNYDSTAAVTAAGADYLIRVRAAGLRLSPSLYPAGYDLQDSEGFYLLALSVDGGFGPAGTVSMDSCVSLSNYAQSASYRAPASSDDEPRESGGGCGSLSSGGPPGNGGVFQLLAAAALLQLGLLLRRRKAAPKQRL